MIWLVNMLKMKVLCLTRGAMIIELVIDYRLYQHQFLALVSDRQRM